MLPLFPYDIAKVVTVCLHSKYLFTFYAKNRLFLIYINSLGQEGMRNGDLKAFSGCFLSFAFMGRNMKFGKKKLLDTILLCLYFLRSSFSGSFFCVFMALHPINIRIFMLEKYEYSYYGKRKDGVCL